MVVDFANLSQRIKEKQYAPIVLLEGEEPFYVDKLTKTIQDTFFETEEEKDFDFQLFYGKDTTVNQIIDASKQFPMMGSKRLIIVREAQGLNKKIDELLPYAQNPQQQTILVLSFTEGEKLNGKLAVYKEIVKKGLVFRSERIYDNKLAPHVLALAKEKNLNIGNREIDLLIAHVGNDLSRINNELDKLITVAADGKTIDTKMIEKYIGISREYNIFELTKSILMKDGNKAFAIIDYFENNPGKLIKTTSFINVFNVFYRLLQYYFTPERLSAGENEQNDILKRLGVFWTDYSVYKMAIHTYPLPKIIHILHYIRQYDLLCKGANGCQKDEIVLLKELTVKIFAI